MEETPKTQLRIEALSQAVRVTLARGGNESDEDTVKRADAYVKFLNETN